MTRNQRDAEAKRVADQKSAEESAARLKRDADKLEKERLAARVSDVPGKIVDPALPTSNHDRNVATAGRETGVPRPTPTEAEMQAAHDAAFAAGEVSTPERDESEIHAAAEIARIGMRTKSLTEENVVQLSSAYLKMFEGRRPRVSSEGEQSELDRLREQLAWYQRKGTARA